MPTPFALEADNESHRRSNWLELFFDLAFVIAISTLSHRLISSPTFESLLGFTGLFLPGWWIWNQFTWYSSQSITAIVGFLGL